MGQVNEHVEKLKGNKGDYYIYGIAGKSGSFLALEKTFKEAKNVNTSTFGIRGKDFANDIGLSDIQFNDLIKKFVQ